MNENEVNNVNNPELTDTDENTESSNEIMQLKSEIEYLRAEVDQIKAGQDSEYSICLADATKMGFTEQIFQIIPVTDHEDFIERLNRLNSFLGKLIHPKLALLDKDSELMLPEEITANHELYIQACKDIAMAMCQKYSEAELLAGTESEYNPLLNKTGEHKPRTIKNNYSAATTYRKRGLRK